MGTVEIRKEIMDFAVEMELKMQTHDEDRGDSWKVCGLSDLAKGLEREMHEYALSGNRQELVDVSNYCMMVWNRRRSSR